MTRFAPLGSKMTPGTLNKVKCEIICKCPQITDPGGRGERFPQKGLRIFFYFLLLRSLMVVPLDGQGLKYQQYFFKSCCFARLHQGLENNVGVKFLDQGHRAQGQRSNDQCQSFLSLSTPGKFKRRAFFI